MPSAKILEQKKQATEKLVATLKAAQSGVVVGYTGITVDLDTEMRSKLRGAGVEYKVYKNTMSSRACKEVGYGDLSDKLVGMTAVATSATDPIAPAKILKEYADKVPTFEIKGGFIDGRVIDVSEVETLASIPPKEVLISKLLGSIRSPLFGFAYAIQAVIDKAGEAAPAQTEAAPAEASETASAEQPAPAAE